MRETIHAVTCGPECWYGPFAWHQAGPESLLRKTLEYLLTPAWRGFEGPPLVATWNWTVHCRSVAAADAAVEED